MSPERSNDLAVHCARQNIPYIPFVSFTEVQDVVQRLVEGKVTVKELNAGVGFDDITKSVEQVLSKAGKDVPKPAAWSS